jgi:hypothetical protein
MQDRQIRRRASDVARMTGADDLASMDVPC